MMIERKKAGILLVDVQEKLTPLVYESQRLVDNCRWLLEVAQALSIPVVIAEQYPKGLGSTLPILRDCVAHDTPFFSKTTFSVMGDPHARSVLAHTGVQQWVLCGIETHVCVQQTALDLLNTSSEVFVVAEAVSSRSIMDHEYALQRMRPWGAQIITREMFLFECLRESGTPEFKSISQRFLK